MWQSEVWLCAAAKPNHGMCSCPSPHAGSLWPAPSSWVLIFIFRCQFNSLNRLTVGKDECQGFWIKKSEICGQVGKYVGLLWLVSAQLPGWQSLDAPSAQKTPGQGQTRFCILGKLLIWVVCFSDKSFSTWAAKDFLTAELSKDWGDSGLVSFFFFFLSNCFCG